MEKKTLYIVVAIVLAVAVLSFYKFTGQSTFTGPEGCIDSDGGEEPYIAGSVTYGNRDDVYTDDCYASGGLQEEKYLKEYYCLDKITSQRYKCEDGCIEDESGAGACVETGEATRRP